MNLRASRTSLLSLAGLAWTLLSATPVWAAPKPSAAAPADSPYRKLAPWVMQKTLPSPEVDVTVSKHDLIELTGSEPGLEWAKNLNYRQDLWDLEFKSKPLRSIEVDVPQANGLLRRKLVWYLVYSVTNTGKTVRPRRLQDTKEYIRDIDPTRPIMFVPRFTLKDVKSGKLYAETISPLAVAAIRGVEDPNRPILSSIDIVRLIQPNDTVWGVATWEDIPPFNSVTITIEGLSSAYRWKDRSGPASASDPAASRIIEHRVLKLNFWRPGGSQTVDGSQIRAGWPGEVDSQWVWE